MRIALISLAAAAAVAGCATAPPTGPMSFFVTSVGSGKGGDLGGLEGADAHCQKLAAASGAGGAAQRKWRAYLSISSPFPTGNAPAVPSINARDRIGKGPWFNAKGELIARDVAHLHNGNNITKSTALTEKGEVVSGSGDPVNNHDIMTGSRADGTAFAPHIDTTCRGWTSSNEGSAIVGHHDRIGRVPDPWAQSWNFSHHSANCSVEGLRSRGSAGMFYCFAAD